MTQDASIDDITLRMGKLEAIISSKMNGLSFASQPKSGAEREAFLGGFSEMPKKAFMAKAEQFVGKPNGFIEICVPGNVCDHVFIKFNAAELMETFVVDSCERALSQGLRLKRNMSPATLEERTRRKIIWQGKEKLAKALRLREKSEKVLFSRRRFWLVGEDGGTVTEMGRLNWDDKIIWDAAAPEPLRNEA